MRTIVSLAMVALLVVAANAESEELYSDKYDYVNVLEILGNDRLREQYYSCFMDTGPCTTADMTFFKGNFPEVIPTKCSRCTEKQKENFDILADWYTKNQPEKWEALIMHFMEKAKEMNSKR